MGFGDRLRSAFGKQGGQPAPGPQIRVHVLLKGRIGDGWYDVDETLSLPEGSTLGALLDQAERDGLRLKRAIESSPHLRHTLMLNGERWPVDVPENLERRLAEGDQVYLLAPLAGG
jgi:molybdopterin converting factor small subunit